MHAALLPLLRASPQLVDALQRVGTIAQLVLLRPTGPSQAGARSSGGIVDAAQHLATDDGASSPVSASWEHSLCVLNTHLFFHPRAPHIRTLHVAAALAEADQLHRRGDSCEWWPRNATVCSVHLQTHGDRAVRQGRGIRAAMRQCLVLQVTGQDADSDAQRPALLLCGDLNSDLNEGIPGVSPDDINAIVKHTHGSNPDSDDVCRDKRQAMLKPGHVICRHSRAAAERSAACRLLGLARGGRLHIRPAAQRPTADSCWRQRRRRSRHRR